MVEVLLEKQSSSFKIHYKRHSQRISIDENHFYVASMASSEYIYFLGDDDFFFPGQFGLLCEFIRLEKPSLAVFSVIDSSKNRTLGSISSIKYSSVDSAFNSLWDKCKFGYIIVQRRLLAEDSFRYLFGTAHAYGCFWLTLFDMQQKGENVAVILCNYSFVGSSCALKNYDFIFVWYVAITQYLQLFQDKLESNQSKKLLQSILERHFTRVFSLRFLLSHLRDTDDILQIKQANPERYKANFLQFCFIRLLGLRFLKYCLGSAKLVRNSLSGIFSIWR